MKPPLLEVRNLVRHFRPHAAGHGVVRAVDGVGFDLAAGETLGIVGESGCGKSTLARLVMALDRPTAGEVAFRGERLFGQPSRTLAKLRRGFQMVFQDPYGSLDPRQTVGRIVGEPLHLDPGASPGSRRRERVLEALSQVGLAPADADRYPHQFSGGQRQRIAIARALVSRPSLIVADEPVSALDLSVQAQILNLLMDLRDSRGLAFLLISHDLAVVETMADRVAVMYAGRIVEAGPADAIFRRPAHPYTRRLIEAAPRLDSLQRRRSRRGPATAAESPTASWLDACAFAPRCPHARVECGHRAPTLVELEPGHQARCHLAGEI